MQYAFYDNCDSNRFAFHLRKVEKRELTSLGYSRHHARMKAIFYGVVGPRDYRSSAAAESSPLR